MTTCSVACLLGMGLLPQPASAQTGASESVVGVCSGVSLPRSVVTDIMGPVNRGIVAPVQNRVNALIGATLGLLLPPLSIDVEELLEDAADGEPITLRAIAADGTIVGPTDLCRAQADSYGLTDPKGIAIGGNQITGLGQNGAQASAADVDAIAFGNGAVAQAGASGSVALGHDATVSAASSVALGHGSDASRGAQIGYTAFGLTNAQSSAGEVSVGSAGGLRQITNVAAGSAATDAATVGQVQGAIDQVNALAANAVSYDSGAQQQITLGGTGGTAIDNLADGAVSAGSAQAVNGSQLYAVDRRVATNGTAITGLETDVLALDSRVFDNEAAVLSLDGRIAVNEGTIDTLGDRVMGNETALAALDGRMITTESDIQTNRRNIAANGTDIAALDGRLGGAETIISANTVAISELDTRVGTSEQRIADNSSNIAAHSAAIAANRADIQSNQTAINGNRDAIAANGAAIASNSANIGLNSDAIRANEAKIADNGTAIARNDSRITQNSSDIAGLQAASASAVRYDVDAQGNRLNSITLSGGDASSAVSIANVADGDLAADSRQAVNGAQLFATNQTVRQNSNSIASLGSRVTVNEDTIVNLDQRTVNIDERVTQVDGRVTNIDARVVDNRTRIDVVEQKVANMPTQYVSAAGVPSATATDQVALLSASGGAATLGNVAAGSLAEGSTEAVNGSQLAATNSRVAQNGSDIANLANTVRGSTVTAVQYSSADAPEEPNGGIRTNRVTFIGMDQAEPVQVHNVAAGIDATDAVNVGQLSSGLNQTLASANDYTDQRVAAFGQDLGNFKRESEAGIAGSLAVAGLPQAIDPGKAMVAGGVGYHRGEAAFALGASSRFNDGQAVVNIGASVDSRGYGSANAGVGFQF
jgi:predicted  nucleic acid-binding Zn-ribbon protein